MREKGRPCRSSRNPNLKSSGEAPAISPKVEPFRIRHGKFGKTLTVNLRLLTVLLTKAAGGDVEFHVFENCEHEWVAKPGPQTDRAREMVKAFIARQVNR